MFPRVINGVMPMAKWFFVLVFVLGASGVPDAPIPEITRALWLSRGVCRVEVPGGGHGSGVAYRRVGGMTYVLTAKHVVEGVSEAWQKQWTVRFAIGNTHIAEQAELIRVAEGDVDLAVLAVKDSLMELVPLASIEWCLQPGESRQVVAYGYPLDMFPCVATIGVATEETEWHLIHNSAMYFGNSGGPVVDLASGCVVGINVLLYHLHGIVPDNTGRAVNIRHIREFVGDQW